MNSTLERYVPWIAVGLALIYIGAKAMPPSTPAGELDLYEFGKIPVQQGGRIKPIVTVADVGLTIISERQEFQIEKDGPKHPAIEWLLETMTSGNAGHTGPASKLKVFRIDHDQILDLLKLERRPGSYRYSMAEIDAQRERYSRKLANGTTREIDRKEAADLLKAGKENELVIEDRLRNEFTRARALPEDQRDVYDGRLMQLESHLNLYQELATRTGPAVIPPPDKESDQWISLLTVERAAERKAMQRLQMLAQMGKIDPKTMKPEEAAALEQEAIRLIIGEMSPATAKFNQILGYYELKNAAEFNSSVQKYREEFLKDVNPDVLDKAGFEAWMNHFSPFYICSMLYLTISIIGCASWLGWHEPLRRTAFALGILTLGLHTFALFARMYIQGRPPVTNLYSSAVFIGWGCIFLCLFLEYIFKNGIGNVVGATLGASTMMIAHRLAESGDTLEMLQAVLDTNFWLATHVTCVTLGYTATYVAGFIGIIYVMRGVFTKSLDPASSKTMGQMMYGVVCFAMLLSFTGTVLGGIWGDQSWGRFWGWDPKENGAVLVVIMNALILHARWAGLVKIRGIALLTIVGNMITTWSWFGTNQLGVGLHAYGFSKELAKGCRFFWLGSLALIGIGLLPMRYWRSFSEDTLNERAAAAKRKPG